MKSSKARQRSATFDAFSLSFKQMCSKIGLIKRGFGLIKRVFLSIGINGVIQDRTILGLLSGWAY